MSKVKEESPGQEVLPIEAAVLSVSEHFDPVRYLNANEGLILLEDLPGDRFDPERPMTYIDFMGEIGVALAEEPPRTTVWDGALEVHGEDFAKATISRLDTTLYFDARSSQRRLEVATIGRRTPRLELPGIVDRNLGVAMSGDEFRSIARSPYDLAKHVHAQTMEANQKRPPEERLDDETLANTAGRSVAHALRAKKEELIKLEIKLQIERAALLAVNSLAGAGENGPKLPLTEMDWYRRVSAIAIHNAVRVSSDQYGYGTTVRRGINRALVSHFHRGTPQARASKLHEYTQWAGYYTNAKRGKIDQSLQLCGQVFGEYRHFLSTKNQES
jgi:hypothetical protein